MPRDRDRRSRDKQDEPEDIAFGQDSPQPFNDDFTADLPETQLRAIGLLNDILRIRRAVTNDTFDSTPIVRNWKS